MLVVTRTRGFGYGAPQVSRASAALGAAAADELLVELDDALLDALLPALLAELLAAAFAEPFAAPFGEPLAAAGGAPDDELLD